MDQKQDTMSVEEFMSTLNVIRADVLASHLIQMEELQSIRNEAFDLDAEIKKFFVRRHEALDSLRKADQRASEVLRAVLDRRNSSLSQ